MPAVVRVVEDQALIGLDLGKECVSVREAPVIIEPAGFVVDVIARHGLIGPDTDRGFGDIPFCVRGAPPRKKSGGLE